jgi:glutaredoxin
MLVLPDAQSPGKYKILHRHHGDRNHHEMENIIRGRVLEKGTLKVEPFNHARFKDAEVFFGQHHRGKNIDAAGKASCSEGACAIISSAARSAAAKDPPIPQGGTGRYTIYGAGWCRFCRKAKLLLERLGSDFDNHDVDEFGGPGVVKEGLARLVESMPETWGTLPIIFNASGAFIGGFSDLVDSMSAEAATAELLEDIDSASQSSFLEFKRFEHEITVAFDDGWELKDEFVRATRDDATCTLRFKMTMSETEAVQVFVVAAGTSPELLKLREEHMQGVKNRGGAIYALGGEDLKREMGEQGGSSVLDPKLLEEDVGVVVKAADEAGNFDAIALPVPGRYRVWGGKNGESAGEIQLKATQGLTLNTLFLTTEPLESATSSS